MTQSGHRQLSISASTLLGWSICLARRSQSQHLRHDTGRLYAQIMASAWSLFWLATSKHNYAATLARNCSTCSWRFETAFSTLSEAPKTICADCCASLAAPATSLRTAETHTGPLAAPATLWES